MIKLNKHNIIFAALADEIVSLLQANRWEEAYLATESFIEYSRKLREEDKKQLRETDREAVKESKD